MIVPMKKASLIIMGDKKAEALKKLRKLGIVHIEISEGSGEGLAKLQQQLSLLESCLFSVGKSKKTEKKQATLEEALAVANAVASLEEEKKKCQTERISINEELERLKDWGDVDPTVIDELANKGLEVSFYSMPKAEYEALGDSITTVKLNKDRSSVKFLLRDSDMSNNKDIIASISTYRLEIPQSSTKDMRQRISELAERMQSIDKQIASYVCYVDSIKKAISDIEKKIEFETYATGMAGETISTDGEKAVSVAYFTGYVEAERIGDLKKSAAENNWALIVDDPTEEDNVPTKLKNNKFVSLIYPLTDFLGTVPGYFEYDISGWFLAFILIFFGIIFGDGGYGLLICAAATVLIIASLVKKKRVAPAFLLVGLFGLSTVVWGTLTCTWFGLPAQQLPIWLQKISVPFISNVYADKIWYPFWTNGEAGLTTAQNLQIFCFTLALIQLTVAHIKGVVRNIRSVKMLGDVGSILQLFGIYYLVLSLVVNGAVFSFGLKLWGIPVGIVSIVMIGVGFCLSFVFSNYNGSIIKSILASVKNIVSVLLGVVNVFSDIVSYIRLWAVGLAGAAISATVNELAGPMLGNFLFMIVAIFLLVFGHGLNMILNVLSVIVHGIRLNTLEFSSHLDMSWSGHKFKPFEE